MASCRFRNTMLNECEVIHGELSRSAEERSSAVFKREAKFVLCKSRNFVVLFVRPGD